MSETGIARRKGKRYQGYSSKTDTHEAERLFEKQYGYAPTTTITTHGGTLVGPIREEKDDGSHEG